MQYRKLNLDDVTWQEIVDKNPSATFYHTPTWTKILCDTFPKWENVTIGFEFEDGNRAVFPMLRRSIIRSTPFYWCESTVPGAYGGAVFQFPANKIHHDIINREISKYRNILVVSNPFSDWQPTGNFRRYDTFIQVIRLTPDFTKIWKNYSRGRRSSINHARKNGIVVKEVDFLEHYQSYYKMYQIQLKRWGRNATDYYPLRLFENLAIYARTNPHIKLWTAWLDKRMVSGWVVFQHNKHLVIWHGSTLDEYFKYRPVDLLTSTIIEIACQSGYEIFDFAKSGGHDNVVEYKERFGAIRLPLSVYRHRNLGGMIYRLGRHFKNHIGKCPED